MIAATQLNLLQIAARAAGGEVTFAAEWEGMRAQPLLSDYTWHHPPLWALQADPARTYLQCGFDPVRVREQFALLKARYGEDFVFHIEWMKNGEGAIVPGSIPIVRYTTEARLNDMIDYCRAIGVFVANPHVNHVEGGGRYRRDHVQFAAKRRYDPLNLLNPGKMASYVPEPE